MNSTLAFTIPLVLIVIVAVWIAVLRHRIVRNAETATRLQAGPGAARSTETWNWPTWPVNREPGDRQPHGRRYSARKRSSA